MINFDTEQITFDTELVTWDGWWFGPGIPGSAMSVELAPIILAMEHTNASILELNSSSVYMEAVAI